VLDFKNAGNFPAKITMILFCAGLLLSLIGSLPPGLISLSVAQTAIARTLRAALFLALGAAMAEFFQAWLANMLSDWFLENPAATRWFEWLSIPVFWGLAILMIFGSKTGQTKADVVMSFSAIRQIGRGILLSTFNLLAIPYWFVYCGWLHMEGWWREDNLSSTLMFSSGVSVGTLCILSLYAYLGNIILRRSATITIYANRMVATLFFFMGLKTFLQLMIKG
jgi:threonine/homoserine/homoserine lactone efflux protein